MQESERPPRDAGIVRRSLLSDFEALKPGRENGQGEPRRNRTRRADATLRPSMPVGEQAATKVTGAG
jgi:hypothetical protein